jgi:tetratricopeptide (TPR) repeat protein
MERHQLLHNVRMLRRQDKSIRTIAAELGVNRGRVARALKALARIAVATSPGMAGRGHELGAMADGLFVGRQKELAQLQAMLADVSSEQGRLVMLAGEPGIGKTRTAQELATYADYTGAQVLWGRCYEHPGAPPYWPWVQSIRSYVQTQSAEVLHADMGAGAADNAMAMLAYEEAQRHYDMALKALALFEPVDQKRRGEILLRLAQAHWSLGRFLDAMETFRQATEVARHINAPEAMAHAALGLAKAQMYPGISSTSAVKLLEEALAGLGDQERALRAQLLGSLARSLAFTASSEYAVAIGQQAVAMAHRLGDPAVLAHTLRDSIFPIWGQPDKIEERIASTTEMMQLAQEAGDGGLLAEAHAYRMFDWLELGNLVMVDAEIEAKERLGEALRNPEKLFMATSWRAMRAILEGRFVEGERLAQQAEEWGQRLQAYGVDGAFGIKMFTIRRAQGRLREIAPAVHLLVQREAEASTWRPGLAVLYSELDMEAEARAEFEHLAEYNFSTLPRDALWLGCLSFLADVCAYLGDAARAALLYELLRPYAGHTIVVSSAVACYGAAARYLGILAATMAKWEDAAQHFEDALEMNARMNARPWLAYTQYQYAEMLVSRQPRADRHKAASLLHEALETACELGMHTLEARITAALASLPSSSQAAPAYPDGLTAREACQIIDTWDVTGMRGSGSHNFAVMDVFVPHERTLPRSYPFQPHHPGLLYIFGVNKVSSRPDAMPSYSPWIGVTSVAMAAVCLGIARGTIDAVIDFIHTQAQQGGQRILRDNPLVQDKVGRAEAALRAARSCVYQTIEELWHEVQHTRANRQEAIPLLNLAGTQAATLAAQAVDLIRNTAGTSSIYRTSPLARRFRDIDVATQNLAIRSENYVSAGRLFLGVT